MITGKTYQLNFNPRRQPKAEKQPRQALQFKNQPPTLTQQESLYPRPAARDRDLKPDYSDKYFQLQKDRSYDVDTSGYSQRLRKQDSRRNEDDRAKQDIANRVKRLQEMVLPLVEREHDEEQLAQFGWQSKIERRLLRIESSLDGVRKQWEIEMEKRIIHMQEQLEQKYQRLKSS